MVNPNTKKTNNPIKNGQKTWIDNFSNKTYWWTTDTWKDAQHLFSSEKWKSKLQWDFTSHLSECLKSATHTHTHTHTHTTAVGKDVEKGEPLALLVGMKTGAASVKNSMELPQIFKNRTTLWSSNCTTKFSP